MIQTQPSKIETAVAIAQSLVYSEGTPYNSPLFKEQLLKKVKLILSMIPFKEGDYEYAVAEYDLENDDYTKFKKDGSLLKTK